MTDPPEKQPLELKPAERREETEQPEPAPKKPARSARLWRLVILCAVLLLVAVVHLVIKDLVYGRILPDLAQQVLNELASVNAERIGAVELDSDGNLVVRDVEITTTRDGVKRRFCRAARVVLAFDGWPLRDSSLRLARVDFFGAEVFVRRDTAGIWNLMWALRRPSRPAAPPADAGPPGTDEAPRDPFPFNGIHLHQGRVVVTLESSDGREVDWAVTGVEARIEKWDGRFRFSPVNGDFYGGRLHADATIHDLHPLGITARLSVEDADVKLLGKKAAFLKHPISGRMEAVLSLTADSETQGRIIAAGQAEVHDGNLYELPAFTGLLGLLALDPIPDRVIHSAQIKFTAERHKIRIDEMNFLGRPLSLFGDGEMALTGEKLRVVLIPRLGVSWNDILPIIGVPLQLLSDIAKGALVPVVLGGAFWAPTFDVAPDERIADPVRKQIEETPSLPK
ncbi:MAG: hypothetical protein HY716_17585 [Planctomycetes bacterium]|nr:hypothetical protein [Planctomycetota bacterium]